MGKARNLRRRLSQYFQTTRQVGKIRSLVEEIASIEVILVNTEVESLILENNLIKRYKPHYNVLMIPDFSGYGYIVQTAEEFPRLLPYKRSKYNQALEQAGLLEIEVRYGPYLTWAIRNLLSKCVSETCGIRSCDPMPRRACYLYHLQRCSAPCEGLVTEEEYHQALEQAVRFLSAPHLHLIGHLTRQMEKAAEELEYERAKHIRDQIAVLKTVFEHQVVERDIKIDQEVIYHRQGKAAVLHIRHGALVGVDWLPTMEGWLSPRAFLVGHYAQYAPHEILINEITGPEAVADALTLRNGSRIEVIVPESAEGKDLIEIARLNYEYRASQDEMNLATAASSAR